MTNRLTIAAAAVASTIMLGACAGNYAGEGALGGAAVGSVATAATGVDVARGAAVGAAVGGAGGALIRKNGRCYRLDNRRRERRVRC